MVNKKINIQDLTQLPGVGAGTSDKLKENGYMNLMAIAATTPGQLKEAAGVTEKASRKMINLARELCELGFELGIDIEKKRLEVRDKIPTGCEVVDELLGGGLELGTSLEAFGEFASGKTQIGHLLAVNTLKKYPKSYVIWIDTENTFCPDRIRHFCEGSEVDPELVLSHIKVSKALSSDHQMLLTEKVEKEINDGNDVKLLIIDSLMNHFRAEYLGRGTLANRQQTLNGYLHKVGKLCDMYGVGVYLTNQVQADPGLAFGDPTKAIGGNIVGHFATIRVYIRKAAKGARKMLLVDSPNLPPGDATFTIEKTKLGSVETKE